MVLSYVLGVECGFVSSNRVHKSCRECLCAGRCFCFQAEDGIRDLVRSRGLGDVYKRQLQHLRDMGAEFAKQFPKIAARLRMDGIEVGDPYICLLYTSDAADERSSVDLGGRRIIKQKTTQDTSILLIMPTTHHKQ